MKDTTSQKSNIKTILFYILVIAFVLFAIIEKKPVDTDECKQETTKRTQNFMIPCPQKSDK